MARTLTYNINTVGLDSSIVQDELPNVIPLTDEYDFNIDVNFLDNAWFDLQEGN